MIRFALRDAMEMVEDLQRRKHLEADERLSGVNGWRLSSTLAATRPPGSSVGSLGPPRT